MTSLGAKKIIQDGFMLTFKGLKFIICLVAFNLYPNKCFNFYKFWKIGENERKVSSDESICPMWEEIWSNNCKPFCWAKFIYKRSENNSSVVKLLEDYEEYEVGIHCDRKATNPHLGRYNAPTTSEVKCFWQHKIPCHKPIITSYIVSTSCTAVTTLLIYTKTVLKQKS